MIGFAKSILRKLKKELEYRRAYKKHCGIIDEMRDGGVFTTLTPSQKQEVQAFYKKHWGEEINLKWHEYYYHVNGIFSPEYIPTYIYYTKICPKFNDPKLIKLYSDKNMIDKLIPTAKKPKTYIKNINGHFYLNGWEPTTLERAIEECSNLEDAIIKHSTETCKGKSVTRFSAKSGQAYIKNDSSTQSVKELLLSYDKNYIVQDAIQQSKDMASLNPTSLNTIRIMTYKRKEDVVILYSVVRMGRKGTVVDNASAGGLYCGINSDGSLKKEAYTLTPFSKNYTSDNGVRFETFVIPKFEEMKSLVKNWHNELPYAKLIGWDLAVDDNNDIVLVEINASEPGLFQAATGPAFGEYIIDIFNDAKSI